MHGQQNIKKIVHLVGFIIRIYHDARSSECQRRGFTVGVAYDCCINKHFGP